MQSSSHSRQTAQTNGRYLTTGSQLVASSEYPDACSSFRIVPVGEDSLHGYQPIVLQDSLGRFLTMRGAKVVTTEKKKNAEVFFLDMTWGEFVILHHHKNHPKWKKKNRFSNHAALKPIAFVSDGEAVVAVSQETVNAGSLLRMWSVE